MRESETKNEREVVKKKETRWGRKDCGRYKMIGVKKAVKKMRKTGRNMRK